MTLLRIKFLASAPKSYTQKFYEILKKYHYREENEILECISNIAEDPQKHQDNSFWTQCPWIKTIEFDEKTQMITLKTTKGEFSFLPISQIFQNELDRIHATAKKKNDRTNKPYKNGYNPNDLENFDFHCHFVTYEFSQLHPETYATTCICPNCFPGSYWLHSYNVAYNQSYVIDIANGFLMSINEFNRLIEPNILDQTLGETVPSRLKAIEEDSSWPFFSITKKTPLKTLAFYQFDSLSKEKREQLIKNLKIQ